MTPQRDPIDERAVVESAAAEGPAAKSPAAKAAAAKNGAAESPAAKRAVAKKTAAKKTAAKKTAAKKTAKAASAKKAAAGAAGASASRAADAVAAGAARAGGERARRRRKVTPLLEGAAARYQGAPDVTDPAGLGPEPREDSAESLPAATEAPVTEAAATEVPTDTSEAPSAATQAPADAEESAAPRGGRAQAQGSAGPGRPPRSSFSRRPKSPAGAQEQADAGPGGTPGRSRPRLSVEEAEREAERAGEALVKGLAADAGHGQVTAAVAAALDFLRRRLTGDYEVDDFGFDPDLTDTLLLALLRPLYKRWFRVEVRGIENVPMTGGALVVANHSGTIALDALMTQVALRDEHPAHRRLRLLGADLVFRTPVVGAFARKSGSTLASNADAEALLTDGQVVGVFPEGFKGIGKPFSERYKLQRFGRGGFVSAALRTQTPIVPCAIVGAEEIYPIIASSGTAARLLNVPYAPITPTWPLLGPLGLIPLPSKWFIEFGEPIWTSELDPAGADDPMLLFDLTDRVRETIQQNLYSLLMQRKSVFF